MIKRAAFILVALTIALGLGCSRRAELPAPQELLETGWSQYRMGEYRQAILSFDKVCAALPETDPDHLMALYGLATTWNLRMPIGDQDKTAAQQHYDRIVDLNPEHDLAAWSLLAKARILHLVPVGQEPDYDAVRDAYADVYARYPERHAGQEAFIYSQATLAQTWEHGPAAQGADNLQAFIKRHPKSDLLGAANEVLAACYEVLDKPHERLDALIAGLDALVLNPDNPTQENSWRYWRIATLAEFEVGNFEIARRFYHRLLEEYPRDVRRYGAESALERMHALEERLRAAEGSDS